MIPQHSSKSVEHYTPIEVVTLARPILRVIHLDPASCPVANRTVKAEKIFTQNDNGLSKEWHGTVFLNPPGGTLNSSPKERKSDPAGCKKKDLEAQEWATRSRATAWWRKLDREFQLHNVTAAIFIGFTLELLRSTQGYSGAHPLDFPTCFPSERLRFGGKQPTHANFITYLGPNVSDFRRVFSSIGYVKG